MKKTNPFLPEIPKMIFRITFFLSLLLILFGCKSKLVTNKFITNSGVYNPLRTDSPKWVDWNILFHEGATSQEISIQLNAFCSSVNSYIDSLNRANGTDYSVTCDTFHCPCDPLLYNFNATAASASGSTIPPPPPKGGGGSGDLVAFNNSFTVDTLYEGSFKINDSLKVTLGSALIDSSKTLAVMDTGLDSTLFENKFHGLLWNDPDSNVTIRNFQWFHNGFPLNYMLDDDKQKHGTAVTAVALKSFEKSGKPTSPKPRIMVLKVLNENSRGSTFTISCGLSYAAQKHATLVNASLGYYSHGIVDSVLRHYVALCNSASPTPLPILAAAGNIPVEHIPGSLCNTPNSGNELNESRTFHPGSFSLNFPNVISVTTLHEGNTACFYQNYSSTYVNVGVVNSKPSCCKFPVSFSPTAGYEGSSFATPFASGQIMACLMQSPGATISSCKSQWSTIPAGQVPVTVGGKFIDNTTP